MAAHSQCPGSTLAYLGLGSMTAAQFSKGGHVPDALTLGQLWLVNFHPWLYPEEHGADVGTLTYTRLTVVAGSGEISIAVPLVLGGIEGILGWLLEHGFESQLYHFTYFVAFSSLFKFFALRQQR